MLLFFIGFVSGGILVAFILNNIHTKKVKDLEAQLAAKAQSALGKVAGKL
jgi:hypothetical protein